MKQLTILTGSDFVCKREPMKDLFQQDISTQDTIYSILCKDD